jgi:hypothetical protein
LFARPPLLTVATINHVATLKLLTSEAFHAAMDTTFERLGTVLHAPMKDVSRVFDKIKGDYEKKSQPQAQYVPPPPPPLTTAQ